MVGRRSIFRKSASAGQKLGRLGIAQVEPVLVDHLDGHVFKPFFPTFIADFGLEFFPYSAAVNRSGNRILLFSAFYTLYLCHPILL